MNRFLRGKYIRRCLLVAGAGLLVLIAAGCSAQLRDSTYSVMASSSGQWQVWYNVNVVVQESHEDNAVNVVCTSPADVEVAGSARFQIYGCNDVVVAENTSADVYTSAAVKARSGSTVNAYGCPNIYAAPDATVATYTGSGAVHRVGASR